MTSVLAFVVAMLVTMALLPVFIRLSRRFAFVDEPAPRKVHATPIPRLGGPAILIGVVAAIALLGSEMPLDERVLLLLAGLIVLTMGVLDDRRELGYRPKLLAQIIAAVLVVYGADIHIKELSLPQTVSFPDWLSHPFSVVVIVGITNAVALSDGLDGLAGGIVFLCSAALALLAYSTGNLDAGLGAIALAGATFGFLRFNTHPASIFMGDGGSQFLGLAAAVLALETTQAEAGRISAVLPLFLLAIPIIDTAQVILVRLSQGRSPFVADRSHLHHRLLDLGLEHRHAVLAIYVVQCLFFLLAHFLRYQSDVLLLLVFLICAATIMMTLFVLTRRHRSIARSPAENKADDGRRALLPGNWRAAYTARLVAVLLVAYVGLLIAALATQPADSTVFSAAVSTQLRILTSALLLVAVLSLIFHHNQALGLVSRGTAYILAAVLAFVASSVDWHPVLAKIELLMLAAMALGSAAWLAMSRHKQAQLTTLDILILFGALVVPNLPGIGIELQGFSLLVLRLVNFFYAVEVIGIGIRGVVAHRVPVALSLALLTSQTFFI